MGLCRTAQRLESGLARVVGGAGLVFDMWFGSSPLLLWELGVDDFEHLVGWERGFQRRWGSEWEDGGYGCECIRVTLCLTGPMCEDGADALGVRGSARRAVVE